METLQECDECYGVENWNEPIGVFENPLILERKTEPKDRSEA